MSITKSYIIKEISNNYPNFLNKDLAKFIDIILNEIKGALKRGERVELRDILTLEPRIQAERNSRNPKNNEKIKIPKKKTILMRVSNKWSKKINEK